MAAARSTVTQRHIARRLRISQSSVAFAFHPTLHRYVSAKKRQRILETAKKMGYVPNSAARRLAHARGFSRATRFDQVGLIYLTTTLTAPDNVCLAMMSGAEQALFELSAVLTFVRVPEECHWVKVDRLARSGFVDGWLVVGQVDDRLAERLESLGQPFVVMGDSCASKPLPRVDADNFAAGQLAARHLARLGHRRIAYLTSSLRMEYQRQTLAGFRAAAAELGLDRDPALFGNIDQMKKRGPVDAPAWLLASPRRPSALFMPETNGAESLSRLLTQAGIDVPRDVSVLDCQTCDANAPADRAYAHVGLHTAEVGRSAALMLHRRATRPDEPITEARVPVSLLDGASIGPGPFAGQPLRRLPDPSGSSPES